MELFFISLLQGESSPRVAGTLIPTGGDSLAFFQTFRGLGFV